MGAVVIDANLAISLVRQMPFSITFRQKIESWIREGTKIAVPCLWDFEVATALRRMWAVKVIAREDAEMGLDHLLRINLERYHPNRDLLQASLRWAERLGQSKAYDSHYIALAENMGAEFWSADQRLVSALREQGATWAHWVGETTP